jgi:predicted TPR repeat methyltransferase
MTNPAIKPAIKLAADEGGYLAYDPEADRLYELNATGALIVELCDGSRTVEEIRALAAPFLPEYQASASNGLTGAPSGQADVVARFISEGLESGLLVPANGVPVPPQDLSPEELTNLIEHLREWGQTQSALRCAKKVTQLTPEDPIAWHTLGGIALAAGMRGIARDAYECYYSQRPEDAFIAHLLIALRNEPPPPRASDDCVRLTFADFSSLYDNKMRDKLGYQAPERLAEFVGAELGVTSNLSILDIGCGTGLAGAALKPRASHLAGIDLSPEMIENARARGIYDSLAVAEITEWLANSRAEFDLIVACDCLVYFGDLTYVAQLAAARLRPGGHFAFTVERGEVFPFHLADSGRFTHHADHICRVAAESGLELARLQPGYLRTEAGLDVTGLFALLRRAHEPVSNAAVSDEAVY